MVKKYLYLFLSLFLIMIDQVIKFLVATYSPNIALLPFLLIVFVKNHGAAFGILGGFQWLFVTVAIMALVFLTYYFHKIKDNQHILFVAWALFVAGVIGNLIDRVFRSYVVDFISIGSFPAFNIADSMLCIGLVLFIYLVWKTK